MGVPPYYRARLFLPVHQAEWEKHGTRRFLVPGDEVTVEIEGIGLLTNPVVEEVFEDKPSKEEEIS